MFDSLETASGCTEKFTLRLSPREARQLEEVASWTRNSKSDVLRTLISWSHGLADKFYRKYPGASRVWGGLDKILDGHYAASKLAMLTEEGKERAAMKAWQLARVIDGERVNYRLNGRALDFYMNAWGRGQSVDDLLKRYAEAAGGRGGPVVDEAEPVMITHASEQEPAEQKPAAGGVEWEIDYVALSKRLLVAVGVLVLVLIALIVLLAVRWGC